MLNNHRNHKDLCNQYCVSMKAKVTDYREALSQLLKDSETSIGNLFTATPKFGFHQLTLSNISITLPSLKTIKQNTPSGILIPANR